MFIEGLKSGLPQSDICMQAAESAVGFLEEIAREWETLKKPFGQIPEPSSGSLAHEMWRAVSLVGHDDLTPMAAVAGTIADATADVLEKRGLTRVVVNNGGDIAVRLKDPESLRIGIRPDISSHEISHTIRVDSSLHVGGICTSGLGGRSLSRGIASAATVFAARASVADAAATAVANATYIPHPSVKRVLAEKLDPDTDLKGIEVTVSVGTLSASDIDRALIQGINCAEQLVKKRTIHGACVAVQGKMACTTTFSPLIHVL
ncbi:FAD:protein FMN transferase [Desulfomonile tiedjei]|nr:FAD:protein FMN transferase [Desulfomonile tiedjei]